MGKRTFGSVRKLPSGRYQARYTGPDGAAYTGRTPEGRAADVRLAAVRRRLPVPRQRRHPGRPWVPRIAPTYGSCRRRWPRTPPRGWRAGTCRRPTRLTYAYRLRHILPALGRHAAARSHPGHGQGVARGPEGLHGPHDARQGVLAAPHDLQHRDRRRHHRRQPVPGPRRRAGEAGPADRARVAGRAGGHRGRDAAAASG